MIFVSCGTPNSVSVCVVISIVGQSDLLPIMIDTSGLFCLLVMARAFHTLAPGLVGEFQEFLRLLELILLLRSLELFKSVPPLDLIKKTIAKIVSAHRLLFTRLEKRVFCLFRILVLNTDIRVWFGPGFRTAG